MNLLQVSRIIDEALNEDLGAGDVTTDAVISPEAAAAGELICRSAGVAAGIPIAGFCFRRLDSRVVFEQDVDDGARVARGRALARVSGPAQPILKAERVALNFLQRLSGIATLTAKFVEAVADYPVKIVDTRKTTPGLRMLEKYAVRAGGGRNHRLGLSDGILIKDNHLMFQQESTNPVEHAISLARRSAGHLRQIEVEAETLEQVEQAIRAGADAILLDNMDVDTLARAVKLARGSGRPMTLEASGNVSLRNIRKIAATGVDVISVGALTHSAPALDISLELHPV
jgi:nicotinate-nucleotide pyrophosphorylase (carboxylating)